MANERIGQSNNEGVDSALAAAQRPWLERTDEFDRHEESALGLVRRSYKGSPHSQRRINNVWLDIWKVWGERTGKTVRIGSLDIQGKRIKEIEAAGRMLIYVPYELSDVDTLPDLAKILPPQFANHLTSHSLGTGEGQHMFENLRRQSGWLSVESQHTAPFVQDEIEEKEKKEAELRRKISEGELTGLTINTYIVATAFSRLMTGRFLDPYVWGGRSSLLLESKIHDGSKENKLSSGFVVYAQAETNSAVAHDLKSGQVLNRLTLWSWAGPVAYDSVRTAEIAAREPTRKKVRSHLDEAGNPEKNTDDFQRVAPVNYETSEERPKNLAGSFVTNKAGQIYEITGSRVIEGQNYIDAIILGQFNQSTSSFPEKFLGERYKFIKPKD